MRSIWLRARRAAFARPLRGFFSGRLPLSAWADAGMEREEMLRVLGEAAPRNPELHGCERRGLRLRFHDEDLVASVKMDFFELAVGLGDNDGHPVVADPLLQASFG